MSRTRSRVVANCRGTCEVCGEKGDSVYVCKTAPDKWRRYVCTDCLIRYIETNAQIRKQEQGMRDAEYVGNETGENSGATGMDTERRILQEVLADTDEQKAGPGQADGGDPAGDSGDRKPKRAKSKGRRG